MMNKSAISIFKNVVAAMLTATRDDNLRRDDYVELMQAIIGEAKIQIAGWESHREPQFLRPAKGQLLPYTPGPYVYRRGTDGCDDTWDIVVESTSEFIVSFHFWDEPDSDSADRTEANACLLATAPQLLETVQRLIALFESFPATIFDDAGSKALSQAKAVCRMAVGRVA